MATGAPRSRRPGLALGRAPAPRLELRARFRVASAGLTAFGVLCLAGCFRHHERGAHDAGTDARARDASVGDARSRDAGRDAGTPCRLEPAAPIEPLRDDEPDVPPGRPSARADALGWLEPPEPTGPACCDVRSVVTERVDCLGSGVPLVARGTDRWGVLNALFREGADLEAIYLGLGVGGGPPSLAHPFRDWPAAMAGGNHRFAVLTRSFSADWPSPPSTGALVVLDEGGAPRASVGVGGGHLGRAIARVPAQHGWAVVAVDEEGDGSAALHLLDESLGALRSLALSRGAPETETRWATPVALGDRVVVVGVREGALVARVVVARTGADLGEHVVFHEPALLHLGLPLGAAAARDAVAIVFGSGTSFAISFDPFSLEAGAAPARLESRRPPAGAFALASDDVGGTIGVCVVGAGTGAGGGPASFFVMDGRGRVLGRAMELEGDASLGCYATATARDTYEVLHGALELATSTQRWTRTTLTVRR